MFIKTRIKEPYCGCFVGCCFQDLFETARCILMNFLSGFFSDRFVKVYVVHPYNRSDTATTWKDFNFILSAILNVYMADNQSIAVHAFPMHLLTFLSVDEILLPRDVNWSTNFSGLSFNVGMVPCYLKHMNSRTTIYIYIYIYIYSYRGMRNGRKVLEICHLM